MSSPTGTAAIVLASATLPAPVAARFASATASAGGAASNPQSQTTITEHIVAWGDTLSRIASIYGLSTETLIAINDLPSPDMLQVGQIIKLPAIPDATGLAYSILPDTRLVRSRDAQSFDVAAFINSQPGILRQLDGLATSRLADGRTVNIDLSASEILEQISLDFSVDARVLLAFLEYRAGLLSSLDIADERLMYPIIAADSPSGRGRPRLYAQLTWLADQLNAGYYGKKFRGEAIIDFADGSRLLYHADINAATAAIQRVFAKMPAETSWQHDVSAGGFGQVYRDLFGDPFLDDEQADGSALQQPKLSLPFRRGEVWRFTGGFHGGWGNGSAWAAIDFAPPEAAQATHFCYTSSHPVIAVARGVIARLSEGTAILDLDMDGNEGSGWTILYLHITHAESLAAGQIVEAGEVLGYPSCEGGFSTATHLHIARRYNGEWIPADCLHCSTSRQVPPFTMSNWQVLGLENQVYQGYMVNLLDNRSAIAEQGRTTINQLSW